MIKLFALMHFTFDFSKMMMVDVLVVMVMMVGCGGIIIGAA